MAPYFSLILLQSARPRWLGGKTVGFKASGAISDELHERSPARRAPLWRRAKFLLFECHVWVHVLLVTVITAAVCYAFGRIARNWSEGTYSSGEAGFRLLTYVFWPPLQWWLTILGLWTPILYIFCPPDVPDRDQLLDRDESGVPTPKPEYMKAINWTSGWFLEACFSLTTVYTTICFILTFFLDFNAPTHGAFALSHS